ncbi:putative transporter MCH2 [Pseudocercospora fuligena]|uniref:Putative transporter MCH2 n=1 Tax=Pseudocercospora fuligena TaxID=685502 RepID=A0A8H6VI63_9PEZI|nr:putative transporter MCH2 [Pseudocercospora fuligena]
MTQTVTEPARAATTSSASNEHLQDDVASEDIEMATLTGTETNVAMREDVPPDGGYGWVCTACFWLINAHTWGVNSAWGVFLAHYLSNSTFAGATHLEYALIGGLSISQSLMISPLVAICNEKLGTRITLLIGTFLVAASMLTSSFATSVWQLFLSQGACFGYGMGFLYITASAIVPQWFSSRRSLAVGIASSGAGFGGLAYNLGAGAGLDNLGWRWTYRILACTTLAVNLLATLLLKDRNKVVRPSKKAFDIKEFVRLETWLIIVWGWMTELGYITLLYSLPNYALSIGLSSQQGSVVGAMLNLGLAFGRPAVGVLSDRFGRINVATIMTALTGVYCLAIWVPAKTYAVLIVFAIAAGTATGTFWGTVVPVTAEVVGLQRLPSAFGMILLPLVLPTTFAEPIALQLVAAKGYLSSQIFVGCMFLAGAASTWALRSWQIQKLEKDKYGNEERGIEYGRLRQSLNGLFSLQKV